MPASFGAALAARRNDLGLTQDQLLHALGERGVQATTTTLSYWENDRKRPQRSKLPAIFSALGFDGREVDDLIRLWAAPPSPVGDEDHHGSSAGEAA